MASEVFVLLSCDFLFAHLINKSRVHILPKWEANTLGKVIFFLQRFTSYAVQFWLILLNQLSRDQLVLLPILLADDLHNYLYRRQNSLYFSYFLVKKIGVLLYIKSKNVKAEPPTKERTRVI